MNGFINVKEITIIINKESNMKKLTITNITAGLLGIITILLSFNIINSEQSISLTTGIPVIVTAIGSIVSAFFAKDNK